MQRSFFHGICLGIFLATTATADVGLRVVTFNTYQGIADTANARAASGNLLTSLDLDGAGPYTSLMPDIVCLQETMSLPNLESFRNDYLPGYQVRKGPTTDGFFSQGYFVRGDITIVRFDEFGTPGPRPTLRMIVQVPGATDYLVIYNAHFKAGQTGSDPDTRRAEANAVANRIAVDRAFGIDADGNGTKEFFPVYYMICGDLNQDDFSGDVIDSLLIGGSNGYPTDLNDVRMESLYGAQYPTVLVKTWSTRTSLSVRYDYQLVSDALFAELDASGDGAVDQDEMNAAGFVYISGHDSGQRASGDTDATTQASDHAPVVLNFTLPGLTGDLDADGDVDLSDLAVLLAHYGTTGGATAEDGDLDGDGDVDLSDLAVLLGNYGA